jgi:hypothetical protein
MHKPSIMKKFIISVTVQIVVACLAAGIHHSWAADLHDEHSPIHPFIVEEMPVRIDAAVLTKSGNKYSLNCSVTNLSDEQITGLRLLLISFDVEGKSRYTIYQTSKVELAGHTSQDISAVLQIKKQVRDDERLILSMQQVIGPQSIWHIDNATLKAAIKSYAIGDQFSWPKVQHLHNLIDTPFPRISDKP